MDSRFYTGSKSCITKKYIQNIKVQDYHDILSEICKEMKEHGENGGTLLSL